MPVQMIIYEGRMPVNDGHCHWRVRRLSSPSRRSHHAAAVARQAHNWIWFANNPTRTWLTSRTGWWT